MAVHDSKQVQQWEAQGHAPLQPNELHGRVRIAYFQFQADRDIAAAAIAQNDSVRLCQLPAGARLIDGWYKFGAFGGSVTLDLGLFAADGSGYLDVAGTVADDPDAIATNVSIATAGAAALFEELAYRGYETEKEVELRGLFEGANPADNVELSGYILYVVD